MLKITKIGKSAAKFLKRKRFRDYPREEEYTNTNYICGNGEYFYIIVTILPMVLVSLQKDTTMVKIYALIHPITLEIKYIGKTERPLNIRLISHIYESKRTKVKTHKHNWILKCISENIRPEIILIEECEDDVWQECEIKWIKFYGLNTLTNSTKGGLGGTSNKLTELHKNNIKQSLLLKIKNGEIDYDARAVKISKSHKGKILSDVTKQKLREVNLGKKTSEEQKIKLSKGGVLQYSLNGELIAEYISIYDAAKAVNGWAGNISWTCLGNKKTYKGFIWKYKNKDIVQS